MKKKRQICIACGGTAGHVNPALAVMEALKALDPSLEISFIISRQGAEEAAIRGTGRPFHRVFAARSPKPSLGAVLRFAGLSILGVLESLWIFIKKRPDLVFTTGGYVSGPPLLAARLLGIPLAIHEQNTFPGKANRRLGQVARLIFLSFPGTARFFRHQERCHVYGNPVHDDFFRITQEEARRRLEIKGALPLIVCLGGSLGAHRINVILLALQRSEEWKALQRDFPAIHLVLSSGPMQKNLPFDQSDPSFTIASHINTRLYMPAADLLIGRPGASFLMEAAACGKASILIPSPNVVEDHQTKNARYFTERDAALCIAEKDLDLSRLLEAIRSLLMDPERSAKMGEAALALAKPQAAQEIAKAMLRSLEDQG